MIMFGIALCIAGLATVAAAAVLYIRRPARRTTVGRHARRPVHVQTFPLAPGHAVGRAVVPDAARGPAGLSWARPPWEPPDPAAGRHRAGTPREQTGWEANLINPGLGAHIEAAVARSRATRAGVGALR